MKGIPVVHKGLRGTGEVSGHGASRQSMKTETDRVRVLAMHIPKHDVVDGSVVDRSLVEMGDGRMALGPFRYKGPAKG